MPRGDRAGFPIYWTGFGQGSRPAVLIHCALAHSGSWSDLARLLSGTLSMQAFDMPGHGRSAPWDGRAEYQQMTARIALTFCQDGQYDVIGHSFGATVALRLAVMQPRAIRSLVLIEPVFFALARHDRPDIYDYFQAQSAGFVAAIDASDNLAAAREFTDLWGSGTPWEKIPAAQRQALADQMHLILAGKEALHNDPSSMLAPGVLQALDCPVLLVEGSASPPVISAIQSGLDVRLTNARRVVIAGAGHMVPITHPGAVAIEILRFLSEAAA